jgi:hypothetical protein
MSSSGCRLHRWCARDALKSDPACPDRAHNQTLGEGMRDYLLARSECFHPLFAVKCPVS